MNTGMHNHVVSSVPMLDAREVKASYGPVSVLGGVTLRVAEHEIVGLRGSNGCGKSTFLKTVAGLVKNQGKSIRFRGAIIDGLPTHERARLGICMAPPHKGIFPTLSVPENLALARLPGVTGEQHRKSLMEALEVFPDLRSESRCPAGSLSGGEQQMLSITRAILMNPKLLLLDEPFRGLANKQRGRLAAYLEGFAARSTRALIVAHHEESLPLPITQVLSLERGKHCGPGQTEMISSLTE